MSAHGPSDFFDGQIIQDTAQASKKRETLMVGTTKIATAITCCFVLLVGSTSYAVGTLATHPDALFGGGPDSGYWRGSVHFDNGGDLVGDLDFAVFTAANFNTNFSGQGYVPSASGLVYTYQLFNTGADAVSAEIVGLSNPADTIGTFAIGDVDASGTSLGAGSAEWYFAPPVGTGDSSYGLAFSSPNLPMVGASLTIDGGFSVVSFGLPTPGPDAIPEPASLLLMSLAGIAVLAVRRRK